ncbi:MAG TPA: preprotein translocase subunit SecG [Myxococcaceae bacterium]|nr:preprotein translocase subunit SecG [Myxococcaceae bacterium]
MLTFFTIVHVLLCIFMMFVILLQPGKDAGMGAALGGGAATSAFGGRGAVTFLSKLTAVCAGLFFLTSLGLSFVGMKPSIAAGISAPAKKAPAKPGGASGAAIPAQDAAPVEQDMDQSAASESAPSTDSTQTSPAPAPAAPEKKPDKKSAAPGTGAAPAQKSTPPPKKP